MTGSLDDINDPPGLRETIPAEGVANDSADSDQLRIEGAPEVRAASRRCP